MIFFIISCFFVGVFVGSFINILIANFIEEKFSIFKLHSHCLKCQKIVFWNKNIIFFLFSGGKCDNCKNEILKFYFIIEFFFGSIAVILYYKHGISLISLQYFLFCTILILLAFIDLKTWSIPLCLPIILIINGLVFGFFCNSKQISYCYQTSFFSRLIGVILGFAFFSIVLIITTFLFRKIGRIKLDETAMGWGDPFVLAGIGAFLGFRLLPIVVFLSSFQGILAYILLRILRIKHNLYKNNNNFLPPNESLPFVPFLALGALEVLFFFI